MGILSSLAKNGGSRRQVGYDDDAPVVRRSVELEEDLEADISSSQDIALCQHTMSHEAILNEVYRTSTSRVHTTVTTGPADTDMVFPTRTDRNNCHDRNGRPKKAGIDGLIKSRSSNPKHIFRRQSSDSSVQSVRGTNFHCLSLSLFLIMMVGLSACATILWVGIASVQNSYQAEFNRNVDEVIQTYEQFISESLLLGMWKHQACREAQESNNPRKSFRRFWEYVDASTLGTDAVSCVVNVTQEERESFENETMAYLVKVEERERQRTNVERNVSSMYYGFKALQFNPATGLMTGVRQSEQPFYFPVHYVEPMEAPVVLMGLDLDAYSILPETIEAAMSTGMPVCSGRHYLFNMNNDTPDYPRFGVTLFHPGVTYQDDDEDVEVNRHLASVAIAFNDVLKRAYQAMNLYNQKMTIIIYDSTNDTSSQSWGDPDGPVFLGGAILHQDGIVRHENTSMEFIPEISLEKSVNLYQSESRKRGTLHTVQTLNFASREWTVLVMCTTASNGDPNSDLAFIALGAALILVATICLCCLIYSNARRIRNLNRIKASVEAEKSAMRLDNARKAAQQERELNDFIAHEVSDSCDCKCVQSYLHVHSLRHRFLAHEYCLTHLFHL
jgi:CHASE1-domain containing sensor protein